MNAAPLSALPTPSAIILVRRSYIRHKQQHVAYLTKHYHEFTLVELEAQLGIPWRRIKKLCERNGIRKRKPNKKGHTSASGVLVG